MWKQYSENKVFHQRLVALKPKARETYQEAHRAELALYDAAARYLDGLKASGERITPKEWRAETACLTVKEKALYQKMKAMRADIKAVEKIRKTADKLARSEKSGHRQQEPER